MKFLILLLPLAADGCGCTDSGFLKCASLILGTG